MLGRRSRQRLEPPLDRQRMRLQPLGPGEHGGGGPKPREARRSQPSRVVRLRKSCTARPEAKRAVRAGRQHVVRPADIVADHLGRERARGRSRRRAGSVAPAPRHPAPISSRCSGASASTRAAASSIRPTTTIAPMLRQLAAAIAARSSRPSCTSTAADHPLREAAVVGDQDRLRALVVLGLREQVGRDPVGVDHGLGDDHDLATGRRSCRSRPGRTPAAWPRRHRRCRGRRSCRPGRSWRCRRPAPPPPGRRRCGRSRRRRRSRPRPARAG